MFSSDPFKDPFFFLFLCVLYIHIYKFKENVLEGYPLNCSSGMLGFGISGVLGKKGELPVLLHVFLYG